MNRVAHISVFLMIAIVLSACGTSRDGLTRYDYSYNGTYNEYHRFSFIQPQQLPEDQIELYALIQDNISRRMQAQGFEEHGMQSDLLITFKLYDEAVKIKTFQQPGFDTWLRKNGANNTHPEITKNIKDQDSRYKKEKDIKNQGLLAIYIIDSHSGEMVWHGYTTSPYDRQTNNMKVQLTRATAQVMDQFKLIRQDYLLPQ